MRSVSRYVPRKYRSVVTRIIIAVVCFTVLIFLLSTDQSTTGAGRADESLFRFDYHDENGDLLDDNLHNYMDEEIKVHQALAPAQHRNTEDNNNLQENLKVGGNFSEEPLLNANVHEYFSPEELVPWFEKPPSDSGSPGEYGKAYRVPDQSEEVKKMIKKGWDNHAFNHYVCEKISLHRNLGDKRDRECKERKWRKPIPTTSVIIIFHNEAWCALLRTVHSVLETSPKVALKEILLVDDASTFGDLKSKLDDYVQSLKVVKIIRLPERSGLIRARLAGAEAASGDVLTFLDSHCECAPHWLEPLLERIAEDPTRVVCPVIEVIDADTFAMSITAARSVQRGIMGWNLNFNWGPQIHGSKGRKTKDDVIASPTMAGGLFAISKKYFNHLGTYDKDMLVWGGENIEMSLRIWTCGGTLEIHPCSHVGHVFRKRAPYSHPGGGSVITRNNKRVAEVWMDEYKEQYYKRVPSARKLEPGDLFERLKLRKELHCRDFQWYIDNIYPDLYAPPKEDILKSGEWHNMERNGKFCLDSSNPKGLTGVKTTMYVCHGMGVNQDFELTRQGEIRHNYVKELCLEPKGATVLTMNCHYPKESVPLRQKWLITSFGQVKNVATNQCIAAVDQNVLLKPCEDVLVQKWMVKDLAR